MIFSLFPKPSSYPLQPDIPHPPLSPFPYSPNYLLFISFLYLLLPIYLYHLSLPSAIRLDFRFLPRLLRFCLLFCPLSPFCLAHPILPLHFLLHSLLLLSQVPSNLHHLLVWLVHFYKVIMWSAILYVHFFEFPQNKLSVHLGKFVVVNFVPDLFILLRIEYFLWYRCSTIDELMNVDGFFFVLHTCF